MSKSKIEVSYSLLKGKASRTSSRKNALCSGIIQAVIDAQSSRTYTDSSGASVTIKKPYIDDLSADGYLRWAISCGLLEYDNSNDTCKISPLGQKLSLSADESTEEYEFLSTALLFYPPVIRVLTLLKEKSGQTKFELGSQLGFIGELGFTSIPQKIFSADLQVYSLTRAGEKALLKAHGNSSNPRLPRIVFFEMLASNKTPNAEFLRLQRAFLLKSISNS